MEGAFTPFRPLSHADQQVFNTVMGGIVGVHYTPHSVSTQVVSRAINYRFLCTRTYVYPDQPTPDVDGNIVIISFTYPGAADETSAPSYQVLEK